MPGPAHDDDSNATGALSQAPLDDSQSLVGNRVGGRYQVGRVLGRGGMGAVYEARTDDGARFALKVIRPEVHQRAGGDAVRRFLREAKAVEQIDSPYVTRVLDAGTDDERGFPYIVMELLTGRDLGRLLRDRGPLESPEVVPLFVQACAGLSAAHARGIIHRDIKPANIFVEDRPNGEVAAKVCDFGVAKQITPLDEGTDLTQSGGLLGSPMYMSPEQARNARNVDHRSDIFSLAVSLYETLSGNRPWQARSVGELVLALWSMDPWPLTSAAPWLDRKLAEAIHKALSRSPADRFQSAEAFGAALAPFGAARVTLTSLRSVPEAKRKEGMTTASQVWSETAVGSTLRGSDVAHFAATPMTGRQETRSPRRRQWTGVAIVAAVIVASGLAWELRARPLGRWWTGGRPTLAIPYPAEGGGNTCPVWLSNAVALGTASELEAAAKVRVVGPRSLAQWTDATAANGKALHDVLGADAVVDARCTRTGSGDEIEVTVGLSSTTDAPPRELASLRRRGSASAPSDLVAQLVTAMRAKLGLEDEARHGEGATTSALPKSPDAVRAYAEGVRSADAHDTASALESLGKVVSKEPHFALGHAVLTEVLAYGGRLADATKESALAAENAPSLGNEERLVVEGDAAAARNAWDQAIEAYAAVVKVFPDRTDVAYRLIQVYTRTSRLTEARAAIEALKARDPGYGNDPRLLAVSASVDTFDKASTAVDEARTARSMAHADGMRALEMSATLTECFALDNASRLDEAAAACADARGLAEALGDASALVSILTRIATITQRRGDLVAANALTDKAIEIARRAGNKMLGAVTLLARAGLEKARGDFISAIADARAGMVEADASGSGYLQVGTRITLAGTLLDSGVVDEAGAIYLEALPMARKNGDDGSTSIILQNLAQYWIEKGDIGRASASATEALQIQQRIKDVGDQPWSLEQLAEIEIEAGEPGLAKNHFDESIALRSTLKLATGAGHVGLSAAYLALGDRDSAMREASLAGDDFHAEGAGNGESEALVMKARILLSRGDLHAAVPALDTAVAKLTAMGASIRDLEPLRVRTLFLAGRTREALALLKTIPDQPLVKRDLRLVADEIALRTGGRDQAVHDLESLASEAHAAGHGRVENAANALIAGKLDEGYR